MCFLITSLSFLPHTRLTLEITSTEFLSYSYEIIALYPAVDDFIKVIVRVNWTVGPRNGRGCNRYQAGGIMTSYTDYVSPNHNSMLMCWIVYMLMTSTYYWKLPYVKRSVSKMYQCSCLYRKRLLDLNCDKFEYMYTYTGPFVVL